MAIHHTPVIVPLSDARKTLVNTEEDIRGRRVIDAEGEEIGVVDDLLLDEAEGKVRFMRVASGGFLGIGRSTFLIPIDAIVRILPDQVHIDRHREHVARAPAYDPDLADVRYLEELYGHYGLGPYWSTGYVYPGFPYYPF